MRLALHNVNFGFVAGAAQGVVVVAAVVVLLADDTAEVLGEVKLETVVGALAGFDEAEGGAAWGGLAGSFSREIEGKKILMIWVIEWVLTLIWGFGSRLPNSHHRPRHPCLSGRAGRRYFR